MADPFTMANVGASILPVLGGIAGGIAGGGARRAAQMEENRRRQILEGIVVPTPEELQFLLEEFRQVGIYDPRLEGMAQQLGGTAMEDISVDPRLREAQMSALGRLSETAGQGLTDADLAELRMMGRQADAESQAQQQALMQEMAMRGQATGGQELAARLQAQQSGIGRRAQSYDQMVMEAQRRALEAALMEGQLGGQIHTQEFDEQAQTAKARDLIDRFNLEQRASTQQRDIERLNEAQRRNLAEGQRIADANVGVQHQQGSMGIDALLESIRQDTAKRGTLAGQAGHAAELQRKEAERRAQQWQDIGTGGGKILGTMGSQ
jgi:hypothetical protein